MSDARNQGHSRNLARSRSGATARCRFFRWGMGMMMRGGMMGGGMLGMFFMLLFWVLLIALIVALVFLEAVS